MKHDGNTLKMIEATLEKLSRLPPAYARKAMLYATSLRNM